MKRLSAVILLLLLASCRNNRESTANEDAAYHAVQAQLNNYLNAGRAVYKFHPVAETKWAHDTISLMASFTGAINGQAATEHPFSASILPDTTASDGWKLLHLTLDGDTIEGYAEAGVPLKTAYQMQALSTPYYAVQVNAHSIAKELKTGKPAADIKSGDKADFYIINATFKNTSQESKLLFDGDLHLITADGKDELFGQPVVIDAPGYGAALEQLSPLATFTTNIVFRIPAGLAGRAYWVPGRLSSAYRIYLGPLVQP